MAHGARPSTTRDRRGWREVVTFPQGAGQVRDLLQWTSLQLGVHRGEEFLSALILHPYQGRQSRLWSHASDVSIEAAWLGLMVYAPQPPSRFVYKQRPPNPFP